MSRTNDVYSVDFKLVYKKFIWFRHQFHVLLYLCALTLIIMGVAIWHKSVYYIVSLFFILGVLEALLVRCPYCGRKPVSFFKAFPSKCPHCGKDYTEEILESD